MRRLHERGHELRRGGFTPELREAFRTHGIKRVLIAYDRDDAGDKAAEKLAPELAAMGMEVFRVLFPRGMDANEYAQRIKPAPKALETAVKAAHWMAGTKQVTVPSAVVDAHAKDRGLAEQAKKAAEEAEHAAIEACGEVPSEEVPLPSVEAEEALVTTPMGGICGGYFSTPHGTVKEEPSASPLVGSRDHDHCQRATSAITLDPELGAPKATTCAMRRASFGRQAVTRALRRCATWAVFLLLFGCTTEHRPTAPQESARESSALEHSPQRPAASSCLTRVALSPATPQAELTLTSGTTLPSSVLVDGATEGVHLSLKRASGETVTCSFTQAYPARGLVLFTQCDDGTLPGEPLGPGRATLRQAGPRLATVNVEFPGCARVYGMAPDPSHLAPRSEYLPDSEGALARAFLLVAWAKGTTRAAANRALASFGAKIAQVLDDDGHTRVRFAKPFRFELAQPSDRVRMPQPDPRQSLRNHPLVEAADFDQRLDQFEEVWESLRAKGLSARDDEPTTSDLLVLNPTAPIEGEFVSVTFRHPPDDVCSLIPTIYPRRPGKPATIIQLVLEPTSQCSLGPDLRYSLPENPADRARSYGMGRRVRLGVLPAGPYVIRAGPAELAFGVAPPDHDPGPLLEDLQLKLAIAHRDPPERCGLGTPHVRDTPKVHREDAPRTMHRLTSMFPNLRDEERIEVWNDAQTIQLTLRDGHYAYEVPRESCAGSMAPFRGTARITRSAGPDAICVCPNPGPERRVAPKRPACCPAVR